MEVVDILRGGYEMQRIKRRHSFKKIVIMDEDVLVDIMELVRIRNEVSAETTYIWVEGRTEEDVGIQATENFAREGIRPKTKFGREGIRPKGGIRPADNLAKEEIQTAENLVKEGIPAADHLAKEGTQ